MTNEKAYAVADWLERCEMPRYPHDLEDPSDLIRSLLLDIENQNTLLRQCQEAMDELVYANKASKAIDALGAVKRYFDE